MAVLSMLLDALSSLAVGLLAAAAWLWVSRPRTSIPGPPALPLLGNLASFYKLPVLLDRLADMQRRYGDIFRFYVGPKLVVVITQPDDVEKLMKTTKPRERDPYVTYLLGTFQGNGLLVSKGEVWKQHRQIIEPAFHTEELAKFMETFHESATFLCERMAESKGAEMEVSVILTMSSTRSVAATILGTRAELVVPDFQTQVDMAAQVVDFNKAFSTMIYRPWTAISFLRWMTEEGRALTRLIHLTEYLVGRALPIARENYGNKKASGRSLLSLLDPEKNSNVAFTEKDIHEEVVTLLSAGIETTTDTLGFALTLLGLHPEWQDLAHRELVDVFGNGADFLRPATITDLYRLIVLDAIVKETLRLFSTVPVMPYLVTEDTPLAGGRHVVPRGSTALVAFYLLHRHPQLFPDPRKFDPGRFLEGGSATTRRPYSYAPFGVGPRKCVGARFAVLQIKTVLATVLRRYRILPGSTREELEDSVLSLTEHPLTGFRVACVPRDNTPLNSA